MILGFIVAGFLAWSFVCGFQFARKVPGRSWTGAFLPGVVALFIAHAAEEGTSGTGDWPERLAQIAVCAVLAAAMAGLGVGVGWIFRPKR